MRSEDEREGEWRRGDGRGAREAGKEGDREGGREGVKDEGREAGPPPQTWSVSSLFRTNRKRMKTCLREGLRGGKRERLANLLSLEAGVQVLHPIKPRTARCFVAHKRASLERRAVSNE